MNLKIKVVLGKLLAKVFSLANVSLCSGSACDDRSESIVSFDWTHQHMWQILLTFVCVCVCVCFFPCDEMVIMMVIILCQVPRIKTSCMF